MGQKLNAWNMSDGTVQVHAVGCQHKPGSGKSKAVQQDQVEFGKAEWFSQEDFARDYWDNGILAEYEADNGEGSFDVFAEMDFKPCVTIPTATNNQKENEMSATDPGEHAGAKTTKAAAKKDVKALPGKAPNEVPPPRSPKSKALPGGKCRCGCGREVGRTSTFAQGHDAKFVSALLAKVQSGGMTQADAVKETAEVSDALKGKMEKALQNAADGATKKADADKIKADKAAKRELVKAAAKAAREVAAKARQTTAVASGVEETDADDLDDDSDADDLDENSDEFNKDTSEDDDF